MVDNPLLIALLVLMSLGGVSVGYAVGNPRLRRMRPYVSALGLLVLIGSIVASSMMIQDLKQTCLDSMKRSGSEMYEGVRKYIPSWPWWSRGEGEKK